MRSSTLSLVGKPDFPSNTRGHLIALVIGRFQVPHRGHFVLFNRAFETARQVIIAVGSAHTARSLRNPMHFKEVEAMIRADLPEQLNNRLTVVGIPDMYNDSAWASRIRREVNRVAAERGMDGIRPEDIRLVGHRKDETSYYLSMFPGWHLDDVGQHEMLNATDFRDAWLRNPEKAFQELGGMLMPEGMSMLKDFTKTPAYNWLAEERRELDIRISEAPNGRLPLTYTTDGVVLCGDHVMMVTRAKTPGRGLLSLPGGHLKANETSLQTLVGNLVVDHGLLVPEFSTRLLASQFVERCVTHEETFDHPSRSSRGRAVSRTFLIEIPMTVAPKLPVLRNGPLGKPQWLVLEDLKTMGEQVFDDHLHIVERMSAKASWRP